MASRFLYLVRHGEAAEGGGLSDAGEEQARRTGERLMLRNGFLVGGQPASDLSIQDGYTSSNHAQFTMDANGTCMVVDLGSTNGTFVNGQRVATSPLQHGMTIKIGATELRFLTE